MSVSAPENITGLRRAIGMTNYLGRFIPDLSTLIKPNDRFVEA